jgi:hypothetical protein
MDGLAGGMGVDADKPHSLLWPYHTHDHYTCVFVRSYKVNIYQIFILKYLFKETKG